MLKGSRSVTIKETQNGWMLLPYSTLHKTAIGAFKAVRRHSSIAPDVAFIITWEPATRAGRLVAETIASQP